MASSASSGLRRAGWRAAANPACSCPTWRPDQQQVVGTCRRDFPWPAGPRSSPITSAKIGERRVSTGPASTGRAGARPPPVQIQQPRRVRRRWTAIPSTIAPPAALAAGTNTCLSPASRAAITMGSTPRTGRISLGQGQPLSQKRAFLPAASALPAVRWPAAGPGTAADRKWSPPFLMSAGARLTVMAAHRAGELPFSWPPAPGRGIPHRRPGSPTTSKPGSPGTNRPPHPPKAVDAKQPQAFHPCEHVHPSPSVVTIQYTDPSRYLLGNGRGNASHSCELSLLKKPPALRSGLWAAMAIDRYRSLAGGLSFSAAPHVGDRPAQPDAAPGLSLLLRILQAARESATTATAAARMIQSAGSSGFLPGPTGFWRSRAVNRPSRFPPPRRCQEPATVHRAGGWPKHGLSPKISRRKVETSSTTQHQQEEAKNAPTIVLVGVEAHPNREWEERVLERMHQLGIWLGWRKPRSPSGISWSPAVSVNSRSKKPPCRWPYETGADDVKPRAPAVPPAVQRPPCPARGRRCSLLFWRGGRSSRRPSTGSMPSARGGRPSVTRLIHSSCMGIRGLSCHSIMGPEHRKNPSLGLQGERKCTALRMLSKMPRPFLDGGDDGGEIVVGQDHVRRALGHVGAGDPHGAADVRRLEGRARR